MTAPPSRVVGINHVALEVGDVEEALAFYGRVFELRLRGRAGGMAFVDMGDDLEKSPEALEEMRRKGLAE